MNKEYFSVETKFKSDTLYVADREIYNIYPAEDFEEIPYWWTILNSGNIPLQSAFVLRGLKNVTIDLGGAKLVFHGRILPFAVYDCENISFKNFSIDYDRPFYTQGTVIESEVGSVVIEIPELYRYRIEGHDFIAVSDTWEHRLITGDMLLRCMDATTGRPSIHSGVILGLIGDEIHPRPNPPLPIMHLYAEDLGNRKVKIFGLPENFKPKVGEILAMTHEDRRKTGFLLERDKDTFIENVRLLHIGAMGITANLCHNISLNNFSMYIDDECPDRIISINADSFHCFHCTGLMKVENCRFENMLDDAINIHGNYLVCKEYKDSKTIIAQNLGAGLLEMEYMLPDDEIYIYKGNTQEIRCKARVKSAEYLPNQTVDIIVKLSEAMDIHVEEGDCIEVRRMPEIEVRNCKIKCMGGFRISSSMKCIIEDCYFENSDFSVLFSGDMDYWFENGPVKDITIKNCTFKDCPKAIYTSCRFKPTEEAPYYHENIKILNNTVISPSNRFVSLDNVNGVEYRNNTIINAKENRSPIRLINCDNVIVE